MTALDPPRHETRRAPDSNWRRRALCRRDPELWFPVGSTGPALIQAEQAKLECNTSCPVLTQCRTYALETGQEHGVWGGMSEQERRALLRGPRLRETDGNRNPEPAYAQIVRERRGEVLALFGEGLSEWQVATRLGTNVQTVRRVRGLLADLDALESETVGVAA